MRILKNIVIAAVVLVAILAVIGFLLPRTFKVERSAVIQAPAEIVFDQVNDLKKTEVWSPWKEPGMTLTYGEITAGKGAMSSWKAEKMGAGSQTIEETVPNEVIRIGLDFGPRGTAKALWTFTKEGEGVKATQTMTGDQGANPFKHYFNLAIDKMIGPKFEEGLANLKQISEAEAVRIKTEQEATKQAAATEEPAAPAAAPAKAAKAK